MKLKEERVRQAAEKKQQLAQKNKNDEEMRRMESLKVDDPQF